MHDFSGLDSGGGIEVFPASIRHDRDPQRNPHQENDSAKSEFDLIVNANFSPEDRWIFDQITEMSGSNEIRLSDEVDKTPTDRLRSFGRFIFKGFERPSQLW
ncbi:hypothetical protein A3A68_02005 [Candidatus Saccharibacteria bacterium RIFCSPLOWO2_01_FULL_48_13]|nr:MAG: hypothetical protein A3F38_01355 [Candidatus Saccharibacteria bacterium RIFCSPHIGHO2_12_FULL_48_21]OGL37197.1 MAG: hypothetical protein A3A68_02005 [Candidatus Saccharibacteria bacterium RIFCSPLOWO2_01_FULL_48_13]